MKDPYMTDATSMSTILRTSIGIYLLLINLILLILLVMIWPGIETIFPKIVQPPDAIRYIVIAAFGGALGTTLISITSFIGFIGNRTLITSWAWWYVARPFIGMTLGVMVYFSIRGGVLKTASGPENLNPYTVAALCGLAGMFSDNILSKLKNIANNQFRIQALSMQGNKVHVSEAEDVEKEVK